MAATAESVGTNVTIRQPHRRDLWCDYLPNNASSAFITLDYYHIYLLFVKIAENYAMLYRQKVLD